jgi:DNA-binding Lrp family transcriptional regulator
VADYHFHPFRDEVSDVPVTLEHEAGAVKLTDLDRDIITALQADGRRPFVQIARDLGVAEKTIRRRVERLRERRIIEITTVADPELLGYGSSALIGLRVDGRRPSEVAADLAALDAVDYVVVATGRYQVIAELLCRDPQELVHMLEERVATVPGVRDVESFPYLRLWYQQPAWDAALQKAERPPAAGPPPQLDDLDRRIIVELNNDGRVAFREIAESLGVSETLVRQRVGRMVDSGGVRIMALTNPLVLGFRLIAWIGVHAGPGVQLEELAERLSSLDSITYLAVCAGRFDIMAESISMNQEDLLRLLDREIRPMPGVDRAEVSICVDMHYKRLRPSF